MPLEARPVISEFLGRRLIAYACSCGFTTQSSRIPVVAEDEMGVHLRQRHADELAELGMGPCGQCGLMTDHVRFRSEHGDAWLCETHAPADQLRALIGEQP